MLLTTWQQPAKQEETYWTLKRIVQTMLGGETAPPRVWEQDLITAGILELLITENVSYVQNSCVLSINRVAFL